MTIKTLSLIQVIAVLTSAVLAITVVLILAKIKNLKPKIRRVIGITIAALLICNIGFSIGTSIFISTAKKHGMYDSSNTVSDVIKYIKSTPVEDKLPNDLTDTMVLYYRFDCTDCHELYNSLVREVEAFESRTGEKIYWVSTRSKQGENLREKFPVASVPSLMYIKDPDAAVSYYLEPVYFKEADGTKFYPVAWDKIIEIRDQYTNGTKYAK